MCGSSQVSVLEKLIHGYFFPMDPETLEDLEIPELDELDDFEPAQPFLIPKSAQNLDLLQTSQAAVVYVPPLNFAVVENGLYRSGHPLPINFGFLKRLNLKTVIYLGDREDQHEYYSWVNLSQLQFHYIHTPSSTEPFVDHDRQVIVQALLILLDKRNFPILVHSNKGKHRVGVLVGVMRKMLQGWSLSGIFHEYVKFAGGKGEADLEYIEIFSQPVQFDPRYKPDWLVDCGPVRSP